MNKVNNDSSIQHEMQLDEYFFKRSLKLIVLPLLLIELALISAYFTLNYAIRTRQIEVLSKSSIDFLEHSAETYSRKLSRERKALDNLLKTYATRILDTLEDTDNLYNQDEPSRYRLSEDGVFYTYRDNGGAAAFYSNITPIAKQDHDRLFRLSNLDLLMKSIVESWPMVTAVYFNSYDGFNRIYPFVDTFSLYPRNTPNQDFIFYYLADESHNPERTSAMTPLYLDPAGHGYMVSLIKPIYDGDFLLGVAGIDIALENLIERLGQLRFPWPAKLLITNAEGVVILDKFIGSTEEEIEDFAVIGNDLSSSLLFAEGFVSGTDWKLRFTVSEDRVFSSVNEVSLRYTKFGIWIAFFLIFFYILFLYWISTASRQTGLLIKGFLDKILEIVDQVRRGLSPLPPQKVGIKELDLISDSFFNSGSDLAKTQRQLERALFDLKQANQARDRFVSSMSHEIRTPLNAILGSAEIVLQQRDLPASLQHSVNIIVEQSAHLDLLTDRLLNFARLRHNELISLEDRDFEATRPLPLIQEILDDFSNWIVKKSLKVNFNTADLEQVYVWVDLSSLYQIFYEIVKNAVIYNQVNGDLLIALSVEEEDFLTISIIDTGFGITDVRKDAFYEPFARFGNEESTIPGIGLGLAMSRDLVNAMGGSIRVYRNRPQGTSVIIKLPIYHESFG